MKKKIGILPAVILAGMLLCLQAVPVYGYFTTNTKAQGGLVIEPIEVTPHETVVEKEKQLTLSNSKTGTPVYVRARGFCGEDTEDFSLLEYSGGEGWSDGGDGWWYFDPILMPQPEGDAGGTIWQTSTLTINISKVIPEDAEVGDSFNVVVVYEAIRPQNGAEGAKESFAAYLARGGEQS